jgi:hypothetical protein
MRLQHQQGLRAAGALHPFPLQHLHTCVLQRSMSASSARSIVTPSPLLLSSASLTLSLSSSSLVSAVYNARIVQRPWACISNTCGGVSKVSAVSSEMCRSAWPCAASIDTEECLKKLTLCCDSLMHPCKHIPNIAQSVVCMQLDWLAPGLPVPLLVVSALMNEASSAVWHVCMSTVRVSLGSVGKMWLEWERRWER